MTQIDWNIADQFIKEFQSSPKHQKKALPSETNTYGKSSKQRLLELTIQRGEEDKKLKALAKDAHTARIKLHKHLKGFRQWIKFCRKERKDPELGMTPEGLLNYDYSDTWELFRLNELPQETHRAMLDEFMTLCRKARKNMGRDWSEDLWSIRGKSDYDLFLEYLRSRF